MFEKDAIRHAFENTIGIECLDKPVEDFSYEELSDELQEKAFDFKAGAEFGYNKAIEELKQAKKLLEKWLFFNSFNSALKKETEDFLGKKTEEIEIPKGVEEIKWQRKN